MAVELEVCAVVVSDQPAKLMQSLAVPPLFPDAETGDPDYVNLVDQYFDFPDQSLKHLGMGLRIRLQNELTLVTLKRQAPQQSDTVQSRLELESVWNPGFARQIHQVLSAFRPLSDCPFSEPAIMLPAWGLSCFQIRQTNRINRLLSQAGQGFAVLSLDAVRFSVAGKPCLHREIELEWVGDLPAKPDYWLARLMCREPGHFRRWPHSKTWTIAWLCDQIRTQGYAAVCGPDGAVHPDVYRHV